MLLTTVAYALLFPLAHAAMVALWSFGETFSRAVTVGAACAVAAAAAWKIFHRRAAPAGTSPAGLTVGLLLLTMR